jgi:uncharacterized membrane protein YsdA (DUF1294 family)
MAEQERRNGTSGRRAEDIYDVWSMKFRESVLFLAGVAAIVHEIWLAPEPRLPILVFIGGLVGAPVAFRLDEKRTAKKNREEEVR